MTTAIEIDHVSKTFKLNTDRALYLKDRLLRMGRSHHKLFTALHDIDLKIEQGETVGLLGHNGSGKSTLLKCIAGIHKPTTGEIRLRGRLASLLELGAGFHHDLTGRENVFINASFLGIPRRDIERTFDDIVAFAELEDFIDTQVKFYSSGMYVRLAFAVAVNCDPDVLLVDEVLAVGDEVFQRKCLDRIAEFQREGRTIVFVTHAADLVRMICDRGVVLDHGRMVADTIPAEAIRVFREHLHAQRSGGAPVVGHDSDPRVHLEGVRIFHPSVPDRPYLYANDPTVIAVAYDAAEPIGDAVVGIDVYDAKGKLVYSADTDRLGTELPKLSGRGEVQFRMQAIPLLEGTYQVGVSLRERTAGRPLDWRDPTEVRFEVVNHTLASGTVLLPMHVVHVPADEPSEEIPLP